jgi:hypothetical protein
VGHPSPQCAPMFSTFHWITVHVAKLLDVLAFTENIEIVIAA